MPDILYEYPTNTPRYIKYRISGIQTEKFTKYLTKSLSELSCDTQPIMWTSTVSIRLKMLIKKLIKKYLPIKRVINVI